MLPKGFVSDKANDLFSPLELGLMRNSIISMIRSFEGPGKRGSSNPAKASTSEICICETDDGTIELGYIQAGKPHSVPQMTIRIDKVEPKFAFVSPKVESVPEEIPESFKTALSKFTGKYTGIRATKLEPTLIIVGTWKDKLYVAFSDSAPTVQFLAEQIALFCQRAKFKDVTLRSTRGGFGLHLMESPSSCRVYAKIAYNVLAHFKGEEFVKNARFEKIRNWILGGIEVEEFASLPQGFHGMGYIQFPEKAHFCFFMRSENNKLVAVVCLYSLFLHVFEFADWDVSLDKHEFPGFLGLICDWKQEQEYTINEWLRSVVTEITME